MKTKTSKIITICLSIIALALLAALLVLIINPVSYHKFEADGYSFEYKGSYGMARRVIIKNGEEKISTVHIKTDAAILDSADDFYAIIADLDGDGDDDILLPTAKNDNDDVICSALLFDGKNFAAYEDSALSNPNLDKETKIIYTRETVRNTIEEATEISPELYELTEKIAKHTFEDATLITLEERAIIYYSENDYYCYSIYQYNEETKDLAYVDEIWFDPIKLDQYPLNWD